MENNSSTAEQIFIDAKKWRSGSRWRRNDALASKAEKFFFFFFDDFFQRREREEGEKLSGN